MIIIIIFTASAFNKFTKIAVGSSLFAPRFAMNAATDAPINTAEPPNIAEILACKPKVSSITAATATVAISWILSILLNTSAVMDADNDLNPVNLKAVANA